MADSRDGAEIINRAIMHGDQPTTEDGEEAATIREAGDCQ